MKDYAYLHQKYLVPTYPYRGKVFVRGQGAYLYDQNDKKHLDLMTNYGVNIFGHSHPSITKVLTRQLSDLTNLHGSFANDLRSQASYELVKRSHGRISRVYWANSGAEAIEAALKFAAFTTGKAQFVATQGGYHGKTLGSLSITYTKKYRLPFKPLLANTSFVKYANPALIEKAITAKTAAVILEPIQGESGIIIPPNNYLSQVAAICQKKKILLIIDEIQTGTGRTGTFLASHHAGIEPDIICLGKGLGGGIPIGATLTSESIATKLPKSVHTSTFGGSPLASAGVLATLKLLTTSQLTSNQNLGEYFLSQLQTLDHPAIKQVRGKGLMLAVELKQKSTPVLKALQTKGILAAPAGDNVVRFLPPYIITKNHIDKTIVALRNILNS